MVTGAVQGVKEKVISPLARRLSDQNEEDFEGVTDNVAAN